MKVILVIETHIYAEEKLIDDLLDNSLPNDIQSCGILGPEIVLPLRRNRHCELEFEYTEETTLKEVREAVIERLESTESFVEIAFFSGEERYWIGNINARLDTLLTKYLDTKNLGRIRVGAYVSADAGAVCREGALRYDVHSHESGKHNRPHVHVRTVSSDYEASIDIENGAVLAGNLPGKLLKIARKKILSDKGYFMKCWSEETDGLRPDIDKHYGCIKF